MLRNFWKCLDHYESFDVGSKNCPENLPDEFWPRVEFAGIDEKPSKYPTRGICPAQDPEIAKDLDNRLEVLIKRTFFCDVNTHRIDLYNSHEFLFIETPLDVPLHRVGLAVETDLSYFASYILPDKCHTFR